MIYLQSKEQLGQWLLCYFVFLCCGMLIGYLPGYMGGSVLIMFLRQKVWFESGGFGQKFFLLACLFLVAETYYGFISTEETQ